MFELESMTGAFLGTLEFHWTAGPERPEIVANRIDDLSASLQDMLFPMVAARQILIDDIKDRFDTERDLEGVPWDDWTPEYEKKKKPGTKLRRTETQDLYQAATSETSYPIVGNDLYANTADWPEYWRIHNQGGTAGKGAKIPKRSFLGFSEEAGFGMIDVFDDWFVGELRINVSPMTGVAQAFEGTRFGGRIGKSYTRRRTSLRAPGMPWSTGFSEFGTPWFG